MRMWLTWMLALLLGASALAPACASPMPARPAAAMRHMAHRGHEAPPPCDADRHAPAGCVGCAVALPDQEALAAVLPTSAPEPLARAGWPIVPGRTPLPDRPPRARS